MGHILVGVLHRTLRTVLTRPGLISGPIGARCVTVDHLQLDLGSEISGYI
jgi:hypothetical protein